MEILDGRSQKIPLHSAAFGQIQFANSLRLLRSIVHSLAVHVPITAMTSVDEFQNDGPRDVRREQ